MSGVTMQIKQPEAMTDWTELSRFCSCKGNNFHHMPRVRRGVEDIVTYFMYSMYMSGKVHLRIKRVIELTGD